MQPPSPDPVQAAGSARPPPPPPGWWVSPTSPDLIGREPERWEFRAVSPHPGGWSLSTALDQLFARRQLRTEPQPLADARSPGRRRSPPGAETLGGRQLAARVQRLRLAVLAQFDSDPDPAGTHGQSVAAHLRRGRAANDGGVGRGQGAAQGSGGGRQWGGRRGRRGRGRGERPGVRERAIHCPEGLGVPGQLDVQGIAALVAWREGVGIPKVNDLVEGTEVR